jgi:hypothetical protein
MIATARALRNDQFQEWGGEQIEQSHVAAAYV